MPLNSSTLNSLPGTFVQLLLRGLLAGLIAGLLAGAVAYVVGEPHIDAAISIEEAESTAHEAAGHSHSDEAPLVTRDGQRGGLLLATGLAGLALGALFASALYFARRHTKWSGSTLALIGAGCGWLAIEAVPFFKYPANPPAVGDPSTIDQRTWLWLATVVLGLLAVAAAVAVGRVTRSGAARFVGPLATFALIVGIGYSVLPVINEVGADFPATLLWEFRIASLATQATLWLALGLAFAYLTERTSKSAEPILV